MGIVSGMARPKGYRLSSQAWDDLVRIKGTNITQVAERAGVGSATISGLLHGHARASLPMAHKVAAALECHPETLFPTIRIDMAEAVA